MLISAISFLWFSTDILSSFFSLSFSVGFPLSHGLLHIVIMALFIGVTEETLVQQRINYGVIFQHTSDLVLAEDIWYHTYEIEIPEIISVPALPTCTMNNRTCLAMSHVLAQLNSLRLETATQLNDTVNSINELVPESKVHKSRSKRSLLPFIGTLSKGLFGTATMDDVKVLASHINQLTKLGIRLTRSLSQHENQLGSFISSANNRMDNLMSGIKDNMLAIQYIQTQLFATETNLEQAMDYLMSILIEQIKSASNLNHELEEFKLGVFDLVNEKLSPLLIPESVVYGTLMDIQNILVTQFNGFRLAVDNVRSVYSTSSFLYARNGTKLYVTVKLPISHFEKPLQLFKVISMPVPINASSPHGTQLLELPKYFAITTDRQHYAELTAADLDACSGRKVLHCSKNFALYPVTTLSCVLALFANDKDKVKSVCDFRFILNVIKPMIIEISPNSLLLYRTPLLSMECSKEHKMVPGCDFCIFKLPCKCSVSTNELYIVPRLGACHKDNDTVTVVHPVNLALLQHFFDDKFVDTIFPDTTFKSIVNVTVPEIKLYKHKMSDIIAADMKSHLSLSKMAAAAKKSAVIYQSLTEPLLEGDINLDSQWPTTDNIFVYCSVAAIVVLTVFLIGTILKVRKLAVVVATLQNVKKCDSFVTNVPSFVYTRQSAPSAQDNSEFRLDISLDQANFVLLCAIVAFTLVIIFRYFRFKHVSKLCLEITAGEQCVLVDLVQLPMCPVHLKIQLPCDIHSLSVHGYLQPKLLVSWPDFCIRNTVTNKTIDVSDTIPLLPFTAFKLRSILKCPYHVYIYKVHHGLMTPLRKHEI